MKYIVKNCPAYQKELITMDFKTGETKATDKNYCMNPFLPNKCQDCTDCVIKQVIEKCKYYQNKIGRTPQYRAGFVDATKEILQLFDIEEINK